MVVNRWDGKRKSPARRWRRRKNDRRRSDSSMKVPAEALLGGHDIVQTPPRVKRHAEVMKSKHQKRLVKDYTQQRFHISKRTAAAIEAELHVLLRLDSQRCTLDALAQTLIGSSAINRTFDAKLHKFHNIRTRKIIAGLNGLRFWRKKANAEVHDKYDFINAMSSLSKSAKCRDTMVSTVHEAKRALSAVLAFPDDSSGGASSNVRQLFGTEVHGNRRESNADSSAAITGSSAPTAAAFSTKAYASAIQRAIDKQSEDASLECNSWKKVTAFTIPAKLPTPDDDDAAGDSATNAASTADGEGSQSVSGFVSSIDSADVMLAKHTSAQLDLHYERQTGESAKVAKARFLQKEREEEAKKKASSLMRPLTQQEEDIANSVMYGRGPGAEILAQAGTDSIQRDSLRRLRCGEWLNDEVIHYFYVMLAKRDEEMQAKDSSRRRSHFFKSFFMTKLLNEGNRSKEGEYEYRNVKRWSKKVPGKNIFNLDKVFFPINQGGMHWICAVAFMQDKRIEIFDSMGSAGTEYLVSIFAYLKDEHKDKQKSELPDQDKWELVPCRNDTPRQRNGFDCGVFTCMFADFLSKDCPLVFTQDHITLCRKRIAISIMNGKAIL